MKHREPCCICSQIVGEKDNDLLSKFFAQEPYTRRVPLESEFFAVIPSLGPLTPGHTLMCPKAHYKSFASLPREYDADYELTKARLVRILESAFQAPVHCFEHGMASTGSRVLCSVEHAHLHLLPAGVDVWQVLQNRGIGWVAVEPTLPRLRSNAGNGEYLYYQCPERQAILAKAEEGGFESQYMRKLFASALGRKHHWNWRRYPLPWEADEAYRRIRSARLSKVGL